MSFLSRLTQRVAEAKRESPQTAEHLSPLIRFHGGDGAETALLPTRGRTETASKLSLATVLVGDIRDYTVLVRKAPTAELQQSVSRVFHHLTAAVVPP